ncbi:MFS transporter [Acetivibrio ethanolgignens]|uniref:Major facilitator superfamily (MFS) profile domain-containing protein n=1 Tax=Acetivibrio ethanolgignens TaxID=290052 RepID=A0A0V8QHN7_9FIRM|nr:MFS transporter [Acetivibrio ethanolgignens]KSV60068.1 hypothetical protein ASU35_06585 [Acetivibrio ethanolgignens]
MKIVKCVDNTDSSVIFYYVALALKSAAIAMPHAFLTLIFLDKGMDYSQIAMIQAFYSCGVVLFEYPSGVLADKYPKKNIYLISSLLLMLSYLLILSTDNYWFLILTWFIYGISTAMETGTIDSDIIIWIKENKDKEKVSNAIGSFISTMSQISSISAIGGACLGFVLHRIINTDIYWVMLGIVLLNVLLIVVFYRIPNRVDKSGNRSILIIVKDSLREIRETKQLRYMLILFALFQMFLQVHYQLWQSLFIEYGINSDWFICIYLSFQLITILAYKAPVNKLFRNTSVPIFMIAIVAVALMFLINKPILQLFLYAVPVFAITIAAYYTEIKYSEIVNVGNISAITSLLSTVMRIFGFAMLIISSRFIAHFSIRILFLIIPICVFSAICFILDRYIIWGNSKASKKME